MTAGDARTLACDVVERELGETPTVARPVAAGSSNDVVEVEVEDGRAFAVRTSRLGTARFDVEHAVMRSAAEAGVPVPAVRFIGRATDADDAPAVMILDWVAAPSLASTGRGDAAMRAAVADTLADVLAAVHSCAVRGFGNLDADLRGRAGHFQDWFVTGAAEKVERSSAVVSRHATEGADLPARAVELLLRHAHLLDDAPEHLAHGDFSPSNLLVDGTRVAAVIDWESAKGGPPALDLGWLRHVDTDGIIDRERLLRSYAATTGHDPDALAAASRLVELRILATTPEWQARAGLTAAIPTTLRRLADALARFEP